MLKISCFESGACAGGRKAARPAIFAITILIASLEGFAIRVSVRTSMFCATADWCGIPCVELAAIIAAATNPRYTFRNLPSPMRSCAEALESHLKLDELLKRSLHRL
ncbi:MAG TPA: hypothetical protein VID67_12175 [Rhizomicrobium sp.]